MADLGTEKTEKTLEELSKRIRDVYQEAADDLSKKLKEYTAKYEAKDKEKREQKAAGKITEQDYANWKAGQIFIGNQWRSKLKQMTTSMVEAEKTAVEIVHGGQLETFADNANFIEYSIDKDTGFEVGGNFSLYDSSTVQTLIEEEPELLRRRYVNGEQCEAWNQKIIANCITQSIIQGESIPETAKRIARDTASTDMKAMVRYARTAMTGAQNAGRIRAMNDSIDHGIKVMKVWIATLDDRTRDAHADLDGTVLDVNVPFENEFGPIMYPGDPSADDANVWNCRCTLGYEYPEYQSQGMRYDQEFGEDIEDMDYDEWYELRKGQIKEKYADKNGAQHENSMTNSHVVVEGKDISETWKRRSDKFAFEIEDIINAQGFDGKPQIVSTDEFDRAVKESGLFCQRVYSAETKETVEEYQRMLYNGKWYVDCSEGGAAFGKGMYAACSYTGEETKQIASAMANYAGPQNNIVETFTLRKDAKIIKYSEITSSVHAEAASKFEDYGSYAAALGYDAITECGRRGYVVVVNRTACIFEEGAKAQDFEPIREHWLTFGR